MSCTGVAAGRREPYCRPSQRERARAGDDERDAPRLCQERHDTHQQRGCRDRDDPEQHEVGLHAHHERERAPEQEGERQEQHARRRRGEGRGAVAPASLSNAARQPAREQQRQRRQDRQDVAGLLADRQAEEEERQPGPREQPQRVHGRAAPLAPPAPARRRGRREQRPGQQAAGDDRQVEPGGRCSLKRVVAKRSTLSPSRKRSRYASPCTCVMAAYQGTATTRAVSGREHPQGVEVAQPPLVPPERQEDDGRQDNGDRALGEDAEARRQSGERRPPEWPRRPIQRADDRGPGRERDEEGEREVWQRGARHGEVAERRGDDGPGPTAVRSSYQRRPHAAVSSASPRPANADHTRAAASPTPATP
jgi:hypothetical protein